MYAVPKGGLGCLGVELRSGREQRKPRGRRCAAMSGPQPYTPAEAAQLLRVPGSWLRKKAAARAIPCTFVGKHLRFSSTNLAEIVEAGAR
jgi:excisionase family DNA binding protein